LTTIFGLQRSTFMRIFPVDRNIFRLDGEDSSYSFDWEEGKQYWFDIVQDPGRDRQHMFCREIRMVDPFGRVDRMLFPLDADVSEIEDLWGKMLDVSAGLTVECMMHGDTNCYWDYREGSAVTTLECTLILPNNRGNGVIYDGSDVFKAEHSDPDLRNWRREFRRACRGLASWDERLSTWTRYTQKEST
jgi:hypothetical protein